MRSAHHSRARFLRPCSLGAFLGAGLLLAAASGAAAQTAPDTTRLHYGEEVVVLPPPAAAPLRVQREEGRLWKLGLNNFLLDAHSLSAPEAYYTRFGLHLAYERQLGRPAWSVLGEVSPAIAHFRPAAGGGLERALSVRAQLAGRYYYNLERRLRQGRRMGGFSANYVSLALGAGLGRRAHETPFYPFLSSDGRLVSADAALLYGLQRRLGRRGFIDANVGLTSRLPAAGRGPDLALNSSLRVGLLLGSPPPPPARPVPADADEGSCSTGTAGTAIWVILRP